ncbi:condensin complex protein MksE [Proteiniphilum sp.]|uniref:condensin complex protein MksE n=1 Tax=Proteiniphilum sp. TaxID=1926877 RepID=UPI002B1FB882|nr:hypothetical protein [Proteiniphilum sp.]MEA4917255.1 hypothetical protein [Proteiniphilum sp.]
MDEAEVTKKYNFLESEDGAVLFSQLVEALKKGAHIQYDGDKALFLYLEKYIDNLMAYFERHENIFLEKSGSENSIYYFPVFLSSSRSNYSLDRTPLPKEHILIALLLYKAYYIDHNIELTSVKKFLTLIRVDMPDLKKNIQRLLVKTKGTQERFTEKNEGHIANEVQRAFRNFHKLRWIDLKEDDFTILPAFQRVTREFADYINHINEWFKDE